MTPQYRFRFYHASLTGGYTDVNQPIGWRGASVDYDRHEKYHGLVKYFKGTFMWYGKALSTILTIEELDGPDANIGVRIDAMHRPYIWEDLFYGMLKPVDLEEQAKGKNPVKMLCPIIRDDFWARFINRADNPVNLMSTEDLDGNVRTLVDKTAIPLPSQKIRAKTRGSETVGFSISGDSMSSGDFIQIGFDNHEIEELKQKFTILTSSNEEKPVSIFDAVDGGSYNFKSRIELSFKQEVGTPPGDCSESTFVTDPTDAYIEFYIQKNNEPEIIFSKSNIVGLSTIYEIDEDFNLNPGDSIRIFGIMSGTGWRNSDSVDNILVWGNDNSLVFITSADFAPTGTAGACEIDNNTFTNKDFGVAPSGEASPTWLEITGDTVFPETETDAFLIRDAAESICSKITGQDNVIVSNLFDIASPGAPKWNAIARGKHYRGNSFDTLDFTMSWKEWWEGAEPMFNLGLAATVVDGQPKIRIENKDYFYNPVPVLNIGNIKDVVRRYDVEKFFKSVEVGFTKWSAESDSGIDDPQTKRILNSPLINFGEDLKILSKWIAASLAIERTRRNRVELGKDDRLDEDILLTALTTALEPEFGDAFDTTNLLNPDYRINIRHTAMRIRNRWAKILNGSFQHSIGTEYKYSQGEGNYKATSKVLDPLDYEYTNQIVEENGNLVTTDQTLWVPKIYEVKFPLTWSNYKIFEANLERAIGLSRTMENFSPQHVISLSYKLHEPSVKALTLQATMINL